MRPRKMLVHHFPFLPLFRKHMRAPPVDLVPSPELYAPVESCHRRPTAHRHVRLLQVVSELRRLLQVVVKRLPQRPQPANPLVLRRRKPHEPAVKQFQRASHVASIDCPHLFPLQLQNLPTHALRHESPPISRSGKRLALILHPPAVASVVEGPHRPSQWSRPIFSSAFASAKGSACAERALSSLYWGSGEANAGCVQLVRVANWRSR